MLDTCPSSPGETPMAPTAPPSDKYHLGGWPGDEVRTQTHTYPPFWDPPFNSERVEHTHTHMQ